MTADLETMTRSELRDEWERVFKRKPPGRSGTKRLRQQIEAERAKLADVVTAEPVVVAAPPHPETAPAVAAKPVEVAPQAPPLPAVVTLLTERARNVLRGFVGDLSAAVVDERPGGVSIIVPIDRFRSRALLDELRGTMRSEFVKCTADGCGVEIRVG